MYRNYKKSCDANGHQLLLVQSGHIWPYSTCIGWVSFMFARIDMIPWSIFILLLRKNNLWRNNMKIMNFDRHLIKISENTAQSLYKYWFNQREMYITEIRFTLILKTVFIRLNCTKWTVFQLKLVALYTKERNMLSN